MASDGTQANSWSGWWLPSISADGRYVAFESDASNLVPGDTNGVPDTFVRDRLSGTTERVSVSTDGEQANDTSTDYGTSISADGRYVAFYSYAINLVPGDTNGVPDVFVRDRLAGTTERVSVSTDGAQGDYPSFYPSISGDGRFVAFCSRAYNLVPGDTNGDYDVFVHDRQARITSRVSVAAGGAQGHGSSGYFGLSISADGSFVAFASNLRPRFQPRVLVFLRFMDLALLHMTGKQGRP